MNNNEFSFKATGHVQTAEFETNFQLMEDAWKYSPENLSKVSINAAIGLMGDGCQK